VADHVRFLGDIEEEDLPACYAAARPLYPSRSRNPCRRRGGRVRYRLRRSCCVVRSVDCGGEWRRGGRRGRWSLRRARGAELTRRRRGGRRAVAERSRPACTARS
jgi:hypothetical protein